MNDLKPLDWEALLARTPARLLAGRAGPSYRTSTHLRLREDHAAARDAVHEELVIERDLPGINVIAASTRARNKEEFLRRPDLGRKLDDASREAVLRSCPHGTDVQIVIGDGLSATAVARQVPTLYPLLAEAATKRGWSLGEPLAVRYCRVGVLNDIGELLDSAVVVLLIGERPGLATAESLSAYMAYRPRAGHTDAQRNLISNIHAHGISHADAVRRIVALAGQMMRRQLSGVEVKEKLEGLPG